MAFAYVSGALSAISDREPQSLAEILRGRTRPVYVYNWANIRQRIDWYRGAFTRPIRICYALKANPHLALLTRMAQKGLGADVVSGGELERALTAGMSPQNIVFSGVGKSTEELSLAISKRIFQINVESIPELKRLADLVKNVKYKVRLALRLNPDVSVATHRYVATGGRENKFGLDPKQLREALAIFKTAPQLELGGLAMHVGSQLIDFEPILQATIRLKEIYLDLSADGWPLTALDIGGGLGLDYAVADEIADHQRLIDYAKGIEAVLADLKTDLVVEPGRFLVARAGALLTRVEYFKETPYSIFVVVNSGINHLLRPALYQAVHRIVPVVDQPGRPAITCDIVGPICESSDVLAIGRQLARPEEGEWLAVLDSGAYGYSMASQYNLRPLPEELIVAAD
jgi:diaminopimelate decarboxylase